MITMVMMMVIDGDDVGDSGDDHDGGNGDDNGDDGTNFLPARFAVQRKLNKFTMQCTKTNGIAGSRIYSAAKGLTKQRHKRCQSTARHIMSRSSSETVSHVAVSLANSFNL